MDHVSKAKRSEIMRAVKSKDTSAEVAIRRMIFRLGYRYRLHAAELPGRPDIVFRRRRKAIFVNGCFWHGHKGCSKARLPKSRIEYWRHKLEVNQNRDKKNLAELRRMGWDVLVLWQCEIKDSERILSEVVRFLESK